jgi:uncharacterized delta-60 repeat protein
MRTKTLKKKPKLMSLSPFFLRVDKDGAFWSLLQVTPFKLMKYLTQTTIKRRSLPVLIAIAAVLAASAASAADGDLDTSFGFVGDTHGANGSVRSMTVKSDGKILIGGRFTAYDSVSRTLVAQLNTDGSLDPSFNVDAGMNPFQTVIKSIVVQQDGRILLGGSFTSSLNGVQRRALIRVNPNGSVDTTFNTGNVGFANATSVDAIVIQPDGKILVSGLFFEYNGVPRRMILRLHADGSLDTSFNDSGIDGNDIFAIALQPDGKMMIGGSINWFSGGIVHNNLGRLNSDGSRDSSFDPGSGPLNTVRAVVLQQDGKAIIGGDFQTYNGVERRGIARVNPAGSLDQTFLPGTGFVGNDNSPVYRIALRSDGKIVVAGFFNTYNGVARRSIVRINSDASVDPTFTSDSDTTQNPYYHALAGQSDGKIIIGGTFERYQGIQRRNVARLLSTAPNAFTLTAAVSRKTHGSSGTFDVPLTLTGTPAVDSRTGGAAGDHTLVFVFSSDVVSGNVTIASGTASIVGSPSFSGNTMTVMLTGVANAQQLTASLNNVTNTASQVLPNTTVPMRFLAGDSNGDSTVNSGDALQTRSRSGQTTDQTNFRSDFNADGNINGGDAIIVRSRSGSSVSATGATDEQ